MNTTQKLTSVLLSSLILAVTGVLFLKPAVSEAQNVQAPYYPNYRPNPVYTQMQPYPGPSYASQPYLAQNTQQNRATYPPSGYSQNTYQPNPNQRQAQPNYNPQAQPAAYPVTQAADTNRENILMILDASESMSAPLNNTESKMVAAKRTVLQVLQATPPNVPVGLRVYGTYKPVNGRMVGAACRASQLVAPISTNNRYQISSELIRIKPTGLTPISYSIQQALLHDFNGVQGKKSIVLITDGLETCDADPCDVAVAMVRSGADVKINVVGYGFHNMNDMKQLKCVALATKGKFYSANTSAELANSLGELLGAQKSVQAQIVIPNQGR